MPGRVIYVPFTETKEEVHPDFSNERSGQWNIFIIIFLKKPRAKDTHSFYNLQISTLCATYISKSQIVIAV